MSDPVQTVDSTTTPPTPSTSTEVVLRPLSELATLNLSEAFLADYESLDPGAQAELIDELREDGIELHLGHLTRVKVPTGGITQFQITDEDGVEQAVRKLIGVVLATIDRRSFWVRKLGEGGGEGDQTGPPDCSSRDAVTGDGMYGVGSDLHPSGDCASCPMAARGSAGTGTQASRCKTQKLLFFASTQEALPMIVAIPPASLGNYTRFRVGGTIKRKRGPGARGRTVKEMVLELEKKKNTNNIEYAEIKFSATDRQFTEDEMTLIAEFRRRTGVMIKENQEALDAMAAASAATEFTESPGPVPFGEDSDDDGLPRDEVSTGARSNAKR